MPNPTAKHLTSLPVFAPSTPPTGPRTIVCFGTARGGTSMVAGAILGLGVPMGERIGKNVEDPAFNLDWHGGPVERFLDDARRIIAARNRQHSVWGWKFPFAQRYLAQLAGDIRAPHLVCVYRDPVPSAVRAKVGQSEGASYMVRRLRAQIRNSAMIDAIGAPCLMVSYEKAAAHPAAFLRELAQFLGLDLPADHDHILRFMAPGSYKDPAELQRAVIPDAAIAAQ
ncbi:sulfotransferase [Hasllibacter sp. MH4015]|uniref:sulfotransferase n=1 Tax=Hasllibacter sp. MH4015 TaxID=2854029 RepID=UPI001CD2F561|nr:sulfotransferase [Hasllibacter sp. MH4015]